MRASRAPGSTLTWGELPLAWQDLPPGHPPSQGSQECLQQEKAAAVSGECCALLSLKTKVPLLHWEAAGSLLEENTKRLFSSN